VLVRSDEDPDISVVIVLWNCSGYLDECLRSLADDPVAVEVVCVDNASEDDSADRAEAWGCAVERSSTNLGFPVAVNRVLPLCRAPVTLLLNPDVTVEPGTLGRCLEALDEAGVGLVGANLLRADGTPDRPAARRFRSLASMTVDALGLPLLSPRLDLQYLPTWDRTTSRDVPCINGAFAMLPTATLRAIGGLDETVFLYLEDQELCRSIENRGERVRFVADARAVHVGGGPTTASSPERRAVAYLHRLDASIEIVHRREGRGARLGAVAVLLVRCSVLLGAALARRDVIARDRYVMALKWLVRQLGRRVAPPPVP
jgi:N-acetylglucosaminyl-diphospho-decaprenol L-rhamnosyltransferase